MKENDQMTQRQIIKLEFVEVPYQFFLFCMPYQGIVPKFGIWGNLMRFEISDFGHKKNEKLRKFKILN